MDKLSNRSKGILLAIMASVMWSTGGVFIKMVDLNPVTIAGLRSFFASIIMLIYIKKPKFTKTKPQIFGIITSCTTVLSFIIANKLTTSANAILLQYTAPIFTVIIGFLILKEKIKLYDIASIGIVLGGMMLFFVGNMDGGNMLGNLMAIGTGFSLAAMTVCLKLEKEGSATDITFFGNFLTFLIAIPFIFGSSINMKSLIIIAIMGVFQLGIPYIAYVNSTKYLSALEVILITVLEPLLSPVWVYIFHGEAPGGFALLGGAIVISTVLIRGIYVSKKEKETEIQ